MTTTNDDSNSVWISDNLDIDHDALIQRFNTLCNLEGESDFLEVLDTRGRYEDCRVHPVQVKVTNVEVTGTSVIVTYDVHYDGFSGCRDIDISYVDEERTALGIREGTRWRFQKCAPLPPRLSPSEEL